MGKQSGPSREATLKSRQTMTHVNYCDYLSLVDVWTVRSLHGFVLRLHEFARRELETIADMK